MNIHLARESGAARIITMHGAPEFAAILHELGLDAVRLAHHPGTEEAKVSKRRRPKDLATDLEPLLFN